MSYAMQKGLCSALLTERAVVLLQRDGGLRVLAGQDNRTECIPGDAVGVGVHTSDVRAKSCDFNKWLPVNLDEVSCDEECD
jgi:hypothetical protein